MDRKRLLKLLSKDLDLDDALDIIEEYCIEWDKEQEDIKKFKEVLTLPIYSHGMCKRGTGIFRETAFYCKII
jgi:hypothetical protein